MLAVGSPHVEAPVAVVTGWTMWAPAGITEGARAARGWALEVELQADPTRATVVRARATRNGDRRRAAVGSGVDIDAYRYSAIRGWTPMTTSAAASSERRRNPHRRPPASPAAPDMDWSKVSWERVMSAASL